MKAIRLGMLLATATGLAASDSTGRMMFRNGKAIEAAAPRSIVRRERLGKRVARRGDRLADVDLEFRFNIEKNFLA